MVVDDEAFNCHAVCGLMRILGLKDQDNVDICYNGEEMVKLVEKAIQENDINRYSLILTDCSMPFMDGYVASRNIRKLIRLAQE